MYDISLNFKAQQMQLQVTNIDAFTFSSQKK
jgi:hypothetical protein